MFIYNIPRGIRKNELMFYYVMESGKTIMLTCPGKTEDCLTKTIVTHLGVYNFLNNSSNSMIKTSLKISRN